MAFSDHGISSASNSSQSVSSPSHRPASPIAVRSRSRIVSVTDSSSKNGRPVRVYSEPVGPSTPKRPRAASASRQTRATAREPMCFSSHTTRSTPSAAYCANASAGCSR